MSHKARYSEISVLFDGGRASISAPQAGAWRSVKKLWEHDIVGVGGRESIEGVTCKKTAAKSRTLPG